MKFAEKNACNKALQNNNSNSVEARFSAGSGSKQRGEDALSKPDVFFTDCAHCLETIQGCFRTSTSMCSTGRGIVCMSSAGRSGLSPPCFAPCRRRRGMRSCNHVTTGRQVLGRIVFGKVVIVCCHGCAIAERGCSDGKNMRSLYEKIGPTPCNTITAWRFVMM
jgi:hypothetical protein